MKFDPPIEEKLSDDISLYVRSAYFNVKGLPTAEVQVWNGTLQSADTLCLANQSARARLSKSVARRVNVPADKVEEALLFICENLTRILAESPANEDSTANTERVISKALPDGRLIEQVDGGFFAVHEPKTNTITYSREVESDGLTYCPLDDDFVLRGGLGLPKRLLEYNDDRQLDVEIETCIRRYCDAPGRELRLAAKYARFTYIADKTLELSYFRATGQPGSGKSRFIGAVGMLCLRPILVTSPTAASLFRMLDAYAPTLIVDECNFESGSEDTTALMQILNCGFQRLTLIPRMEKTDGRLTLRMFSAYGPKLIGSLKLSDSPAFESRCVSVALQKTTRKDLPFRMSMRMLNDFAELRAKLTLWRLRNWHADFESQLEQAEAELKQYAIEPRFVQIAIPLYGMLADDTELKANFARMLEGRTEDATTERRESFDGQLVTAFHSLLFDVDDTGNATIRRDASLPDPEDGKPCESVTVERITEILNEGLPDKRKHTSRWIGKQIRKLGLATKEISRRNSENWKKTALIFDRIALAQVFKQFSLPVPADFHPVIPVNPVSDSKESNLTDRMKNPEEAQKEVPSGQVKYNVSNDLDELTGMTGRDFGKSQKDNYFDEFSDEVFDFVCMEQGGEIDR